MPFDDIVSLATQASKDEALRRKKEQEAIVQREVDAAAKDDTGIMGLMKANPRLQLSPGAAKEFQGSTFAADNRTRRAQHELTNLDEPPTPDKLIGDWLGEAGRSFATEDPGNRTTELAVDPRGRAARLEALKNEIVGAPTEKGPERSFSVGTGAHGEPYFTNLSRGELHAEHHDRNAMRDVAGLPNEAPPVTDLHPLHMGGGGGTFSNLGGRIGDRSSPESRAKEALIRSLDLETRAAKEAPLTDREAAGAQLKHEPAWDQQAADNGYTSTKKRLLEATASGEVPPEISAHLQKKYDTYFKQALKDDPGRAEENFIEQVNSRREVPKAAVVAAATRPSAMEQAAQELGLATEAHGEAASSGPGTTLPKMRDVLAGAARYGVPIAADVAAGALGATGVGALPAAGLAFGGGAAGELLANLIEGQSPTLEGMGEAGGVNALGGLAARGIGRLGSRLVKGMKGAKGISEGMQGVGAKLGQGLGKETVETAGRGSARAGAAAHAAPDVPRQAVSGQLPALRGGGFKMGAEGPLQSATRPAAQLPAVQEQGMADLLQTLESIGIDPRTVPSEQMQQLLDQIYGGSFTKR